MLQASDILIKSAIYIVWNLIKILHSNEHQTNILTWTSCSQAGGCILHDFGCYSVTF